MLPVEPRLTEDQSWPEDSHRLATGLPRRAIDDQLSVEVVQLVLRDARCHVLEVDSNLLAVLVTALDPDRSRALDRDRHTLQGKAPLVVRFHLGTPADDLRVDERDDLVLLRREDEHALQDANLCRRETDPVGLLHQLSHAGGEPAQIIVELLDGSRLHAQHGVRVLPDLREGKLPPRLALGVELPGPYLSLNFAHDRHTNGVKQRERELIMRQGVHHPETPRDRAERAGLEEDLKDSPLTGAPIHRRLRNFRPDATAQLAALGGPLSWMRRLRSIEIELELHQHQLAEAWQALREECGADADRFAREWRRCAERWNFDEVNQLIDRHNRHFPAESRLPMNPRTGDFVLVNGKPYTRATVGADWILSRFPPEGADFED